MTEMNENITDSQYHAVDEELATGSDYMRRDGKKPSLNNNIGAGRLNVTSDCDNRASGNMRSKSSHSQNQDSGFATSGEVSRGDSALNINGWPAAPQKLRGVSMPLFIGDSVLTLFPIAFLGTLSVFQRLLGNFI
jgi:hypothetical protein